MLDISGDGAHRTKTFLKGISSLKLFPPAFSCLVLSPSGAELHIGQCISCNHPCPPPRRDQLPTSVPILAGLRGWSPANSSSVFPFPFSSRRPVHHLFGSSILFNSGHMTQPLSLLLPMVQPSPSCLVLSLIVLFGNLSIHEISFSAISDAPPQVFFPYF